MKPITVSRAIKNIVEVKEKIIIFSKGILKGERRIIYVVSLIPNPEMDIGNREARLAIALAIAK